VTKDDYKRCICDTIGNGAADCTVAEDGEEEDPSDTETELSSTESEEETQSESEQEEETESEKESESESESDSESDKSDEKKVIVNDPSDEFAHIWSRPHYAPSRSAHQVDQTLLYVEQLLEEMHAVF